MPSSGCPLPDTPFGNQPKAPAGLPGFQRHPFIRDVAFDPGGVEPSRFNDGLHAAFNVENRLSLRDITYFVAQSHTPHDRCLRFGPHVTMTPARLAPSLPATALAGRDLHPQDIAGFAQRTPNEVFASLGPRKGSKTILISRPNFFIGRFKLHLSGSDIRYRTDGQDPTPDSGEYLQARGIFILNATEMPIDFRAIRRGKEDAILTIIPLEEVEEE